MALYWPDKKVALDIIDDPCRNPFEGDADYTVLRVTCAELSNYDSCVEVLHELADLLGEDMPAIPDWQRHNRSWHDLMAPLMQTCGMHADHLQCDDTPRGADGDAAFSSIEILAQSDEQAQVMMAAARQAGHRVRKVSVWDGPVPDGSFEFLDSGMRMSTPEYLFFRKANQLSFAEAVKLGFELCGKYRTQLTQYDAAEDEYDYLCLPRSSKGAIRRYLRNVRGTKEYKCAKKVLRAVVDEAASPMSAHLCMLLCLSRSHGGYGLKQPLLSCVFESEDGLLPASSGPYLAYDLAWLRDHTAVQYTGECKPSARQLDALCTQDMRVVCFTNKDIADLDRFDLLARKVAKLLDAELPEDNERWREARRRLRDRLKMPRYEHMRITMEDLTEHRIA